MVIFYIYKSESLVAIVQGTTYSFKVNDSHIGLYVYSGWTKAGTVFLDKNYRMKIDTERRIEIYT